MSNHCPHDKQRYHFGHGGKDEEHQRHQADIGYLLDHHHQLQRQVTLLDNGFSATTTSDQPEVVEVLQRHVLDMKARFDKGRAIRSWDAVYALLFAYKDHIDVDYQLITNGIQSRVTTQDPELVEAVQAHAHAVSGFVRQGRAVSGEGYPLSDAALEKLNRYLHKSVD